MATETNWGIGALSRSVIFDGAEILNCWYQSQRILLASLESANQRRLVQDKVWAPSKIIIFDGAQIYTVLV